MHKNGTHYLNYIGGQWLDSDQLIEVFNPANEELIATIACADEADVKRAVSAALKCVDSGVLSKPRPVARARMVHRIAEELRALMSYGVPLLIAENGKTKAEATQEFEVAIRYFEYYAGIADKIEGRSIPLGDDYVDFTYYEPVGISAQIVPWNYPLDICARSLAPALAAGNAVIIKSPELTPLSISCIALACERAGVPSGAVNILCGQGSVAGAALVADPNINQIVFTGSVSTGQSILHAAAENALPCVMELGGKSAAVVFADADLDTLITSVDWGIFFNAGQVCSAMSRLLVHEDIYEQVVSRVKALAEAQVMGDGADPETTLTAVASKAQQTHILQLCQRAVAQGAELITGATTKPESKGYFVAPIVLANVAPDSEIFSTEVFGPVIAITAFKTEEQAYQLANATKFGLVAGVFTRDISTAMRASKALKAGQIFVNEWFAGGVETPFGGLKLSGFGREKGQEALYSYVNTKNVAIRVS
jgi:aldehyde dehydrogenase (NAD+)